MLNAQLRAAAGRDDVQTVAQLLQAGADPYAVDDAGRTAFNHAASNGLMALDLMTRAAFADTQKPQAERLWPEYGLNTPSGAYGSTLITYAAKVCPAEVVAEMIAAGADIGIVNGSGWSLLHCAAVMPGRGEVLALVLKAFQGQKRGDLIRARTTHVYETDYDGHKVVFGTGLSAAELCRARIAQDPSCPPELAAYPAILQA